MIRAPKICGGSHIRAGLSGYIAELGAAFVSARLGIANEPRPDHAAYISSWLRVLKDDPRAILTAASLAQAAADYLEETAQASCPAALEEAA
ncbi:MAG: antirestriction protein ArdC [Novosphingobium sp.]|uniref:zincin-like metallopeptidase domain-containing protein n=1 Tax=Novosphingobium sp. TaxID=1874826 RepID=UPI00261806E7|nr:zincin-like metallopeptidase domain-containing protein [Novosphingobium sp.]MCP5385456.1 antirestriction protein ArdC [Novosphingobium sp.]